MSHWVLMSWLHQLIEIQLSREYLIFLVGWWICSNNYQNQVHSTDVVWTTSTYLQSLHFFVTIVVGESWYMVYVTRAEPYHNVSCKRGWLIKKIFLGPKVLSRLQSLRKTRITNVWLHCHSMIPNLFTIQRMWSK